MALKKPISTKCTISSNLTQACRKEPKITWTHYQALLAISDEETRQNLENLTKENSLTVSDLKIKNNKTAVRLKAPRVVPSLEFERGLRGFNYQIKRNSWC